MWIDKEADKGRRGTLLQHMKDQAERSCNIPWKLAD